MKVFKTLTLNVCIRDKDFSGLRILPTRHLCFTIEAADGQKLSFEVQETDVPDVLIAIENTLASDKPWSLSQISLL